MSLGVVSKAEMIEHDPTFAKLTVWWGRRKDKIQVLCKMNEITNVYVSLHNDTEKGGISFGRWQEILLQKQHLS